MLYARLRGLRLRARVTGCELYHRLANHPGLSRHRLCVVVESAQTASAFSAWAAHASRLPNAIVLVAPAGLADAPAAQLQLAADIGRLSPTILVLTLGAPISEIFAHYYREKLGPCWVLCVGQAVRVELGLAERAPVPWRALGMEWLWRIRQEPRRLVGRYVKALAWFPVAVLHDFSPVRVRPAVAL